MVVFAPKLLRALGFEQAQVLILPWWSQTFLVMGLTTLLWVTVALMTQPDPPPVLDNFYQRARPLGVWTPVCRRMGCEEKGRSWQLVQRGFGIAIFGAVGVMTYILGISNLLVGKRRPGGVYLSIAAVLLALFFRWLRSFLRLLDAHTQSSVKPALPVG